MVPEFETFQEDLRKSLKEKGYHVETWETMQIGATIGVHTGPYPMGLGILKNVKSKEEIGVVALNIRDIHLIRQLLFKNYGLR